MNSWHTSLALAACLAFGQTLAAEKLYVAVEGDGKLAVIDTQSNRISKTIDLAEHGSDAHTPFSPHNVQVAPDGRSVWVTAMAGGHGGEHEGHGAAAPADQVIVIDPANDTIAKRIPIASGAHLAHVVLSPDSRHVYVTAQNDNSVYQIDANALRVEKRIPLPPRSQPHGLRVSPKDGRAYVALLGGKGMAIVDDSGAVSTLPLDGAAVQTAVTPSGSLIFASLYDTRQIAVFTPETQSIGYLRLPSDSKGPVQMYPTRDGRYLLVADQGHYFGQPAGRLVYKLNVNNGAVVARIAAGDAPHGVVASRDSRLAYVTNLLSGDVSVIDTEKNTEVARIPVGAQPNGVSLWSSTTGGTP